MNVSRRFSKVRIRMFLAATLGLAILTGCSPANTEATPGAAPAPTLTTPPPSSSKVTTTFDAKLTELGFASPYEEDGGTAWFSPDWDATHGVKIVVGQSKVRLLSFPTEDSITVNCRQTDGITPDNLGQMIDFFRPEEGKPMRSGCKLEA